MDYNKFIESKRHIVGDFGFEPVWMPDNMFDFQQHLVALSLRKGRRANFADTGLGKTRIQLVIAKNVAEKTGRRVLIVTPLAVAFQFLKEAAQIGITDIEHSKDGKVSAQIVVCNYERLHYFNPNDFDGLILDESSILKNFGGATKKEVTAFSKKIKYRFLATATPSPNDFIELGSSSEILGYMGYMDMLGRFFKNNTNTSDSRNRNIGQKYYLKPHAEDDFFEWVNQWASMVRMPSDIGFSDERYILPSLIVNDHMVKNQSLIDRNGQIQMFTPIAQSLLDIRHEQKQTVIDRCEKAVQLAEGKTSVYWCNTNDEGDLLEEMDKDSVQVSGSMSLEKKEDILMAFGDGEIKRLITKPKMTSFGLNWQHCNHTVCFPTFSYEQYYQLVRRFYRFGQKSDVTVDRVISDGQTRVTDAIDEKAAKATDLYTKLTKSVNGAKDFEKKQLSSTIRVPSWI